MEKKYLKISIITPTYNQAQFIQRTINSVYEQNYPNLEYIVIDGGSTDNTLKILKDCKEKIDWISEPDKGQADAINKGIKRATGDILAFINSDDYYLPGVFNKVVDIFLNNPEVKWVTGSYVIVDKDGHPIQPLAVHYKNVIRVFSSLGILKFTNYIVQPSTFWRRNVHDEIGCFDITLRYAFDYDFWMRLMRYYPAYCIGIPLSAFRIHSESKGGKGYQTQFDEELEVLKRYDCSKVEYFLHKIHNKLIVFIYGIIK
jgi:glycosyltransferase involved in cell wall biosynthesis